MNDLINRQMAIDVIMEEPSEVRYPAFYAEKIKQLSSAQYEPLTDIEQRIFLAAIGREEKVCKEVDAEWTSESYWTSKPYEISLVSVCKEIERKVKKALWS